MCGIAGIINLDGRPVPELLLDKMNEVQVHRGPDDNGVFLHDNVGMAHRRLSIIDVEGGQQPFFSDDKQVVLVYNGEIYNYKEIRKELESDFHFKTDSDTEVLLKAYLKWGIDCIKHFRGMFAFAIYDQRMEHLYVVRDRVGIKPLYYSESTTHFVFASEINALMVLPHVKREISPDGLAGYLRYQYVPTPYSIYKDIWKLEAGHFIRVDLKNNNIEKKEYWNIEDVNSKNEKESDCLAELNHLLTDTTRMYVRSDVPFGAFLSGGVDSSLVTALMSQSLDNPVETFSIGFNDKEHSELPYASEASATLKTNHHAKVLSSELSQDLLSKIVSHFGEPFGDSSAIPTYMVSQLASKHVKMVLSGDGGDELFGGYWSYENAYREYTNPLTPTYSPIFRLIARYGVYNRLKRYAAYRGAGFQEKHDRQREIFDDQSLRELLRFDNQVYSHPFDEVGEGLDFKDPVTRFQFQDFKTYLLDDILTKVDRMSMANSLEVRIPLLDHKVVEFAFSLPLSLKIHQHGEVIMKYLLKKSAASFFKDSFLNRKKMGFGIPIVKWVRNDFRPYIEDELRNKNNGIYDWIRYSVVQRLLDRCFTGDDSQIAKIWILWMLSLWMKNNNNGLAIAKN